MIASLEELAGRTESSLSRLYPDRIKIGVGVGTCGLANGAGDVLEAIKSQIADMKLDYSAHGTGCVGFCQMEPIVDVLVPGLPRIFYHHMSEQNARELVESLAEGKLRPDLALMRLERDQLLTCTERKLTGETDELKKIPPLEQLPFYKAQMKIAIRNCGFVDPHNIDDYIATGGYASLAKVLTSMEPEQVIEALEKSGLRGRGGGGFATGRKWNSCRKAKGYPKYVLCNGDEGDPGAFMDRSIMEGNPHSVLEGMAIGAYAIGSGCGYIYVRLEYPLAVENLRIAITQARGEGLLGENIMGTGFNFDVRISRGAGAFVCGESTALMASIEGLAGEPRAKHIHTAEKGLFGKPTNLNNVETWANVPVIIKQGHKWFAGIGTDGSKGTKVFSLVGNVKNTGLVEVPMGITLREVVFDIGGGIIDDRPFKAMQTGGPSGGCLPQSQLDLPIDFESLTEAGSMMGSGGMIVMDDRVCMVEVAKYFTKFLCNESCGKCTSCREGLGRMSDLLEKITSGQAEPEDVELLEEVSYYVRDNSICGLGKSAANPTLSVLKYFPDEFTAHVTDRKCPAGVCRELTTFTIDADLCKACGKCIEACPVGAISGKKKGLHKIDPEKCTACGECRNICPFDAVITA